MCKHIYTCDFCGFNSEVAIETETHEATHFRNGLTLEEYRDWKGLKEIASHMGAKVSLCKNENTENEFNKAIEELLTFEKNHGIVNNKLGR